MMNVDYYMKQAQKHRVLALAEELDLARRYQGGDDKAGHAIICANLRFAVRMAHQYRRRSGCDLDELIQEANEGMMIALKKFDPDRGFKFITYASWWIRARLNRFTARSKSIVSPATATCAAEVAHDESLSECVNVLQWDGPAPGDELSDLEEVSEVRTIVRSGIKTLRESVLVDRRILSDEPETLERVGHRFGVSRERTRQIESALLRRVEEGLKKAGFGNE